MKDAINKGSPPKLYSIITVCYNAESCIRETIQSVFEQTYTNYEYIIIDGKSTDNTMMIVDEYRLAFAEKGIPFIVVSEKDNGIYDAMNKGIDISTGKWINFMNAGDRFYDNRTLEKLVPICEDGRYDLVFGDTVLKDGKYFKYSKCSDFFREMSFCHQSAFTKSKHLKKLHFDERYRISADNHFYVRMSNKPITSCRLDFPISVFLTDGLSSNNLNKIWREYALILWNEGIWNEQQYKTRIEEIEAIENKRIIDEEAEKLPKKITRKDMVKKMIPPFVMNLRYKRIAKKRRKKDGWSKKCP